MKSIIILEEQRFEWAQRTFPDGTALSSLEKLEDEIQEIRNEIILGTTNGPHSDFIADLSTEYADALMCLFDSAGRMGIKPHVILEAFERKLEINKKRDWVKNDNNTYSHVK
jgi:hypothetical protein